MPSHSIPMALRAVVPVLALLLTVAPLVSYAAATRMPAEELSEHRCIHDQLESSATLAALGFDVTANVISDPFAPSKSVSSARSSSYRPIRIATSTLDLTVSGHYCASAGSTVSNMQGGTVSCTSADILTDARRNTLVNTLLPRAIQLHEERLNVLRYNGNLQIPSMSGSICGSFTVPSSHRTTGVDADMVMYVAGAPATSGTIAWATSCLLYSNRPVVGVINFSPRYIDGSRSSIRVAVHEMAHALGFSYNYWLSYTGITMATVSLRGKTARLITSPKVLAAARAQYGCPTMAGMEIEDQGGDGTALSHWKRRDAQEELMAGIAGVGFYTALTLASFEDTGKYTVNYDKAEPMNWGYQSGCGLINNKCVISGVSQYPSMFCTSAGAESCTADFMDFGVCGMAQYATSLPTQYQYFSDPTIGGSSNLMDYCPIIVRYSDGECTNTANAKATDPFYFGSTSRCLNSRSVSYSNYGSTPGLCVNISCNTETKEVSVRPKDGSWVKCPAAGGEVSIAGGSFASGYVTCPTYNQICVTGDLIGESTYERNSESAALLSMYWRVPAAVALLVCLLLL